MSEQKNQLSEQEKKEVNKAFARAEAFWKIISEHTPTRALAMKIGTTEFSALEGSEKIALVKISTLLVRANNDIEKAFKESEKKEQETQNQIFGEAKEKVNVQGIAPEAQETPEETIAAAEAQAKAQETPEEEKPQAEKTA